MEVALTIAGSDSGGGAGIQADLKTFAAFGVHGTSAITAVTAQNTLRVLSIFPLPPIEVYNQIRAVLDDFHVGAIKTGMLADEGIIKAVSLALKDVKVPLVVDPIIESTSGAKLLSDDDIELLKKEIIPKAFLVTPNIREAEVLSGLSIKSVEDMREAAVYIVKELKARAVLIKGGHLKGARAVDVLYYKGGVKFYSHPFVRGCTHGTGCALSAAITANLAKGKPLDEAITVSKEFISIAIKYASKVGKGECPVDPIAWLHLRRI
ncbi:hypothetical protein PAP_03995 [Palaeococcus pacificus DY20341]|uniref:Pyridoxamine kinase/Phosphomethylpyrimidine kinase domain-containing protein n=1 Tax=Palaeococcus pacificus DY20341 TaxID=1343739 RepID=A0A075LSY9_9EURY|nr:bifunctional hydroxymethylpyrimidine kinase/phosphomethylpyrimidine kinase [Palaeococcus pacificus]AIF69216.1 hypothetical protein PAP_03995 [Palaeococcus pacificus DY20341]